MDSYKIAIVGAGPAGLSAAAHAAELDRKAGRATPAHILLEGFGAHAKTIQRYQKGKHVMAEPGFLDLRSDVRFAAGTREGILEGWREDLARLRVNVRFNAEVTRIAGAKGAFTLQLGDGSSLLAENVVLAIGLEGNPRKLGCPGDELEVVQYQLDDPREYRDETILVVGAGDSAIENALGLREQNDVWIVNRGKEFSRAKEGNLAAVVAAISDERSRLNCYYESSIKLLRKADGAGRPWVAELQTPAGQITIGCDRVIARLGAIAPRRFVESIGIRFPNDRADAIPALSAEYESNVPGVYVIGALAGYPLIKQAINQGHDVVEFIHGNRIKPADHGLLEQRFLALPYEMDADTSIRQFQLRIPMFRQLNALAFRELIIESEMIAAYPAGAMYDDARAKVQAAAEKLAGMGRAPRVTRIIREGDTIYAPGEFGTSFYTIVDGEVTLSMPGDPDSAVTMVRGEFFGEMSLLSGRPRLEKAVAGQACVVVETPRRTMIKLMNSNEEVREGIDWIFVVRELQRHFVPRAPFRELKAIAARVTSRKYKAGEAVYVEGQNGESLFVVRSGGIALTRQRDGADAMVAQVRAGEVIGQMALMGDPVRRESATATVASELLEIRGPEFAELMRRKDAQLAPVQDSVSQSVVESARMQVRPEAGSLMSFLMDQGLGEATDVLVINEELCVGCDNCEKACAETHGGVSRLDREAGATFARVHIPIACRHCEQPHCMKDCPPNAIRRSETGEVYIDDTCIGCGNCESNCPYDVIKMVYDAPEKTGLLSWLIFGGGGGPGEQAGYKPTEAAKAKGRKAVKCDACIGQSGGPACVRACPTGAALRLGPEQFIDLVEERKR
jgi:Fe-S-cluster-containing hydrogenase component 2/thioredoxin reductase